MDLNQLYQLRQNFIVIGLTGRVGAGCSTIANIFETESFEECKFPEPKEELLNVSSDNNERKYKIAYNFLQQNWKPFFLIKYSRIISLLVFRQKLSNFVELTNEVKGNFKLSDLSKEVEKIEELRKSTNFEITLETQEEKYNFFISKDFEKFHNKFDEALRATDDLTRIKILHTLCNNQRRGGCYYCGNDPSMQDIYSIAEEINSVIKGYRKSNNNICHVVIDSLRNPLEIMYFKERFSAYYTLAINPEEEIKEKQLQKKYKSNIDDIKKIDEIEYGAKNDKVDFYKQNVQKCIEKADLHLSFLDNNDNDNSPAEGAEISYPFNINQQIVIFYSLMLQPGIVTPTPQERCMQIAYTAKYNSGCISRQVGAVIADQYYSIKSIGWNNTPEGHVPCVLRNSQDLIDKKDTVAFSSYEKDEKSDFRKEFDKHFTSIDTTNIKGHNCSYCFKDIQNSITEGKNQVHTRSLHAEENAMLQISKYGGQPLKNGILFTTASPCELCSKKALQLGVKKIYYIDPYPGIAISHILECGEPDNIPKLYRFTGAVGRAYHKLYETFMPYKDEIYIRTNTTITNKLKKLEDDNKNLRAELEKYKQPSQ
jgi:deoxycytidylate deaminase